MKTIARLTSLILVVMLALPTAADDASQNQPTESGPAASEAKATQPELGIGVAPLPPVLTSHLPEVIGKGRGVLISNVTEGSPAEKAGLRKHDVLIRYDDQDLYSPEQLVKRVRNDDPGKEVELEYVRAGKLQTVMVTLGEKPLVAPIESKWPGFMKRFEVPLIPATPDFLTEDQDLEGNGTEWTHFESMSVMKGPDGKYYASVKYKGEDGTSIERDYTGTRQEVRDAIEEDKQLPDAQREQLLRSLDDRGDKKFPDFPFRTLPDDWTPWRQPWNQELFNWPDLSF